MSSRIFPSDFLFFPPVSHLNSSLSDGVVVHTYPSHLTLTFSRLLSPGHGAATLTTPSVAGLDVAVLEQADALSRRIASYATQSVGGARPVARAGAGEPDSGAAAAALGVGADELGASILDAAATGPGFYPEAAASGDDGGDGDDAETARGSARAPPPLPPAADTSPPPPDPPPPASRRDAFACLALRDASSRLRRVGPTPTWGRGLLVAASGVASAGCALTFWGGSPFDAALAGGLGAAVGALGVASSGPWGSGGERGGVARAPGYELMAAFCVSLLCRVAQAGAEARRSPPVCPAAVRLGALQWLLQGAWRPRGSRAALSNIHKVCLCVCLKRVISQDTTCRWRWLS